MQMSHDQIREKLREKIKGQPEQWVTERKNMLAQNRVPVLKQGNINPVKVEYNRVAWEHVKNFYREFEGNGCYINLEVDGDVGIFARSFIDTLAAGLFIFRRKHHEDFQGGRKPVFLDLGSGDGRAVVLANILGYRAFGIEGYDIYFESIHFIKRLSETMPSLRDVKIANGNYKKEDPYRELGISLPDVDVFYNYDDSNVPDIAAMIHQKGRCGAKLILQTCMVYDGKIPLRLKEFIHTEEYPDIDADFDVYVNE